MSFSPFRTAQLSIPEITSTYVVLTAAHSTAQFSGPLSADLFARAVEALRQARIVGSALPGLDIGLDAVALIKVAVDSEGRLIRLAPGTAPGISGPSAPTVIADGLEAHMDIHEFFNVFAEKLDLKSTVHVLTTLWDNFAASSGNRYLLVSRNSSELAAQFALLTHGGGHYALSEGFTLISSNDHRLIDLFHSLHERFEAPYCAVALAGSRTSVMFYASDGFDAECEYHIAAHHLPSAEPLALPESSTGMAGQIVDELRISSGAELLETLKWTDAEPPTLFDELADQEVEAEVAASLIPFGLAAQQHRDSPQSLVGALTSAMKMPDKVSQLIQSWSRLRNEQLEHNGFTALTIENGYAPEVVAQRLKPALDLASGFSSRASSTRRALRLLRLQIWARIVFCLPVALFLLASALGFIPSAEGKEVFGRVGSGFMGIFLAFHAIQGLRAIPSLALFKGLVAHTADSPNPVDSVQGSSAGFTPVTPSAMLSAPTSDLPSATQVHARPSRKKSVDDDVPPGMISL